MFAEEEGYRHFAEEGSSRKTDLLRPPGGCESFQELKRIFSAAIGSDRWMGGVAGSAGDLYNLRVHSQQINDEITYFLQDADDYKVLQVYQTLERNDFVIDEYPGDWSSVPLPAREAVAKLVIAPRKEVFDLILRSRSRSIIERAMQRFRLPVMKVFAESYLEAGIKERVQIQLKSKVPEPLLGHLSAALCWTLNLGSAFSVGLSSSAELQSLLTKGMSAPDSSRSYEAERRALLELIQAVQAGSLPRPLGALSDTSLRIIRLGKFLKAQRP